jgi:hypothetical protein
VLTVSADVPVPVGMEGGTKAHVGAGVTAGVMVQERVTALLKPLSAATVTVEVDVPPAATEAGVSAVAATVKSAGPVTVKPTDALWVSEPEVPVTVMVEVAAGVVLAVLILRADVAGDAPGVTELGEKAQLAPAGKLTAAQVKVTALLKPLVAVTVTV